MNDNLDDLIRNLVARAVKAAPAPPDITRFDVAGEPADADRRRWWYGGGVSLATAAAILAVFVVSVDDEQTASPTPATQPAVAVPSPTPAATAPPTAPSTTVATTATTTAPTTATPPTAEAPAVQVLDAAPAAATTLAAGPDGVVEHTAGGVTVRTDTPMAIALDVGDERIIAQETSGWNGAGGDEATVPVVLTDGASPRPLFDTSDWDGAVRLHDVEAVDGRSLLLFSLATAMDDPERADETLYVVDLGSGDRTEVAALGGWESTTSRLHLATTGLVVGEWSSGAAHGIAIHAVPGSPASTAALPTPADLGLDDLGDCIDCPRSFTVSPDGQTLAWIDGASSLVVRGVDGAAPQSVRLRADDLGATGDLDIGGGVAIVNPHAHRGARAAPPRQFELTDPAAAPTPLDGVVATLGPAATLPPLTLPTSPPTTTTPPTAPPPTVTVEPPASDGADGVVTAGPGGVVAYHDGIARVVTDEPMAMAIATGDGRYLVQRRTGNAPGTEAANTSPLLLAADGTLTPLWPDAPPAYHTLYDIEVVGGRRLVVYSTVAEQPLNIEGDLTAHLLVADLDDPRGEPVELDTVDTWEGGIHQLHLSTTGMIAGEVSESLERRLAVYAVPGSDADGELPTPESLGLDGTYTDCSDCPERFTISPHGTVLAWLDRTPGIDGHTELVLHPTDGGPTQRYDPFRADVNTTLVRTLDHLADGSQLLTYDDLDGETPRPPVLITNDGTALALTGIVATADPTAG